MKKKDVFEMAEGYSRIALAQMSYMAGFQAACNIIRQKIDTCHMEEFVSEMEELSEVAYMDLDSDD